MENESNEGNIDKLGRVVVELKRYFEKLDAHAERQAAKIAEKDAQIKLQQRLLDSHEHRIEMLEVALKLNGKFDA
ncbi:MAG TPA: hypothetical protein VK638_44220 [Edaphobacter sp.]|nr:hypothetical protein [Edaphobacter sp.]